MQQQAQKSCSNPRCKAPTETRWSYASHRAPWQHWYDDGNGGFLCERCYSQKTRKSTMSGRRCKHEVFTHYFGENYHCQGDKFLHNECKMNNIVALQLHHPNGGGDAHRFEIFGDANICGVRFYMWLRRTGYPKIDLDLLCANCHAIIEAERREAKYR
jgi:hypothetical protein